MKRPADPTVQFFADLGRRGHEPLLAKATGSVRIDVRDGEHTETWSVSVNDGDVSVGRRRSGAACVVRVDRSLFDRIVLGEENAIAAMLRGALQLEGNLGLLVAFQRLFPGPPKGRSKGRPAGFAQRRS